MQIYYFVIFCLKISQSITTTDLRQLIRDATLFFIEGYLNEHK